jgi:hypothetical protein
MTAIPLVLDALVAALRLAPDLAAVDVFDGPQPIAAGGEGIAVGASREDNSVEFTWPPADLAGGDAEHATIACLVWSGSGDTTFAPARLRVAELLDAVDAALSANRTLSGAVTRAWITDGVLQQQQANGALVTCEFHVETDLF